LSVHFPAASKYGDEEKPQAFQTKSSVGFTVGAAVVERSSTAELSQ
jgi:hypothetical protein